MAGAACGGGLGALFIMAAGGSLREATTFALSGFIGTSLIVAIFVFAIKLARR
jgi:hypothetical protein